MAQPEVCQEMRWDIRRGFKMRLLVCVKVINHTGLKGAAYGVL